MLGNAFCFQFAKHPACSKMGICGRGESSFKEVVMCVVVSGNKIFILASVLKHRLQYLSQDDSAFPGDCNITYNTHTSKALVSYFKLLKGKNAASHREPSFSQKVPDLIKIFRKKLHSFKIKIIRRCKVFDIKERKS